MEEPDEVVGRRGYRHGLRVRRRHEIGRCRAARLDDARPRATRAERGSAHQRARPGAHAVSQCAAVGVRRRGADCKVSTRIRRRRGSAKRDRRRCLGNRHVHASGHCVVVIRVGRCEGDRSAVGPGIRGHGRRGKGEGACCRCCNARS